MIVKSSLAFTCIPGRQTHSRIHIEDAAHAQVQYKCLLSNSGHSLRTLGRFANTNTIHSKALLLRLTLFDSRYRSQTVCSRTICKSNDAQLLFGGVDIRSRLRSLFLSHVSHLVVLCVGLLFNALLLPDQPELGHELLDSSVASSA